MVTSGTPARRLEVRALKLMFALAGLLALIRYVVVYYNTSEFNHFVTQEAQRTRQNGQLKWALLNRARDYSLPVKEADIDITTRNGVFSVVVNYRVTLDLLIYRPELKFRASGAGLVQ